MREGETSWRSQPATSYWVADQHVNNNQTAEPAPHLLGS